MPGGRRESQCDVFALVLTDAGTIAVAVEAKVDEPFGRTLKDWLANASSGKRARLAAICEILGCPEPPGDLRYQLFHRTAAAALEARRMGAAGAAMLVQSFSAADRWSEDFAAFTAFLGATPGPGTALIQTLPDGRMLTLGWARGDARFLAEIEA